MKRKALVYLSIILLLLIPTIITNISKSFSVKETNKESISISDAIIKNNTILENNHEPGLYKNKDSYYFIGNTINNYIKINNDLWRIMKINENKTVKLIKDTPINDQKYIVNEEYTTENYQNSIIYQELQKYYENELKSIKEIIKTEYCIKYNNNCLESNNSYISLVTEEEIKDITIEENNLSFINTKDFWIMSNNYLDEEINQAFFGIYNEYEQIDKTFVDDSKFIVPVITLDSNTITEGNGTKENPYIIVK